MGQNHSSLPIMFLAMFAILGFPRSLHLDEGIARPVSSVKFEQDSDVKCLMYAIEAGDPETGPSTHILRASPRCVIPWHYHTAEEQLVVIGGTVSTEMEGMVATSLGPGGFAMMPSKRNHQFWCGAGKECLMIVSFDRRYDIVWLKSDVGSR
jgi:quercetin dioxygenase-like cupin family protein